MPLSGLEGEFTFESFLEVLRNFHIKTGEEVRIFAYITDMPDTRLSALMSKFGFAVKSMGAITEVKANYVQTEQTSFATFYCHLENNLLLCFTSHSIDDANRTMDKFVNQQNRIYPLWIHPAVFDTIRRKILDKNPETLITEFHATRDNYLRMDDTKVLRGDFNRYFRYIGDDGRFTLEEISRAYGVYPTHILFLIPNVCKFRITDSGKFAFISGNMQFLFGIINEVLASVMSTKKIIDKAKTEFIPVNMGKKEIRLPKVIPLNINFSRELDFSEMEKLVDNMTGGDFNFEIYDMTLMQGSIHLSGTIIDKNKNIGFNITGDSQKIVLSPRKDTSFDSMLHFYKLIVDRLDVGAQCSVPTVVR